ncbi:TonB family protein [Gilvimarinus polysaccharolyticus]|uniref:TonB family protein n=1 Tax=Gilvimarinus polysaccharolyticus TaxID=863921 RepID=UPI000A07A517|nr:TonB family protein [Gilvimarinus polysaccharolyticus]
MCILRAPVFWILSLFVLGANLVQAAPLLNGMALHQELGRDQFIGAIYSDTLSSDASTLMAANQAMRMELKITADRGIAARKFSRMWIEGMAINIRGNALTEQADNMVSFTKLFQERLQKDDHVVFSLTPGQGVVISVDDVNLGTIADDDFFGLLLSTWLGRVPLSSTYREQLLVSGDVSASLVDRYDSINPTPARVDQVALWGAPAPKPAPKPEPVPAPAPEPTPAPVVASAPVSIPDTAQISVPKIEIPAAPTANTAASASSTSDDIAQIEGPAPISSSSSSSVAPIALNEPEPLDESDEDFVPIFTAESLLANQRYFSNLVRQIQAEISYPRRAMQRGYEGSIRIAITINRNGELLNSMLIEETDHKLLNNEALGAVQDAVPFPEVPALITGQVHEFTIPITFTLQQN